MVGLAEFADLKMRDPAEEDCVGQCFRAKHMSEYLEEFAGKMVHDGKSLKSRLRRTEVLQISRGSGDKGMKWKVECRDLGSMNDTGVHEHLTIRTQDIGPEDTDSTSPISTEKLIMATGEISTPNIPSFPNQDNFSAPIIHSTFVGSSGIFATPNIKHVAVIGAGKSSADILYASLKTLPPSTTIHWIIRKDGTGPGFFTPIDVPTPYKNAIESANTMAMSILQPSIFHEDSWWVWLFHRTWFGMWLVTWIFSQLDIEARRRAGFNRRGSAAHARGFDDLDYSPSVFWQNSAGGALHHKDFWDLIAARVVVHRAHVTSMSHHKLHLSDDTEIQCDALLLGTGWKSSLHILSDELKVEFGLPHDPDLDAHATREHWSKLENEADASVTKSFPLLANPPPHYLKKARTTPYRLYRGMVPIADPTRSIVFINFILAGNMMMNAEVQAMWAVAYLTSPALIHLPSASQMGIDVARTVAWCQRRYLSTGQLGNFAGFDATLYTDVLLKDMGVEGPWRESGVWGVRRPEALGRAWKLWMDRVGAKKIVK